MIWRGQEALEFLKIMQCANQHCVINSVMTIVILPGNRISCQGFSTWSKG